MPNPRATRKRAESASKPDDVRVSVREFRQRLTHLLGRVEFTGLTIVVTKYDREVARLVPAAVPADTELRHTA